MYCESNPHRSVSKDDRAGCSGEEEEEPEEVWGEEPPPGEPPPARKFCDVFPKHFRRTLSGIGMCDALGGRGEEGLSPLLFYTVLSKVAKGGPKVANECGRILRLV